MSRIVLGIDPGSLKTGWGVVEVEGSQVRYLGAGILRLGTGSMAERLLCLHQGLSEVFMEFRPGVCAVEEVFLAKNFQSALKLGQARGVAVLAAGLHAVPVEEFAAKTVKQAVCGQGQATKAQMQSMVIRLLGLSENPGEDAADALGIAVCCAHTKTGAGAEARFRLSTRARGRSQRRWRLEEDSQ